MRDIKTIDCAKCGTPLLQPTPTTVEPCSVCSSTALQKAYDIGRSETLERIEQYVNIHPVRITERLKQACDQ